MAAALSAFGVPATVTRPAPNNTPLLTTGIWMSPTAESEPFGTDFQKLGTRKVFAVPRSAALSSVPRGTIVVAAEMLGAALKTWRVDGYAGPAEPDQLRLFLVDTGNG
jgi:hypothetical protein